MQRANALNKPVITATQMLESMTTFRRPTRAEATDVANAILDGTDCVMLSGESAMGQYPTESVVMLAKIAAAIESHRPEWCVNESLKAAGGDETVNLAELIASSVKAVMNRITPAVVIVPTHSGATARSISRYRLPVWIVGVSSQVATCQRLQFTSGVHPEHEVDHPEDWRAFAREWLHDHGVKGDMVIVTEGPSTKHPETNNRMELIDLNK
jgi:pyruvate kinase